MGLTEFKFRTIQSVKNTQEKLSASMAYASLSVAERIQNGLLNVGVRSICDVANAVDG